MCEAVDNFGMKYATWVKYPPSFFIIITASNIANSLKKEKLKFQLPAKIISQKDKIKKIYLKPQKDVGKTELKLPRSGFVHHKKICSIAP